MHAPSQPARRRPASRLLRIAAAAATALLASAAHAAWVWTEGEKPDASTVTRFPQWYDQVRRDLFSGGDFISHWSDQRPGTASYDVRLPEAGEYRLWVRGNPIQSTLRVKVGAEADRTVNLAAGSGSTNVAGDDKPDLRFLAWADAGAFRLPAGTTRVTFTFASANNNHGYLDAFLLTTEPFQPMGALRPEQIAAEKERIAAANKGWFPWAPPADDFSPSPIDLRDLNEKVAGESGWVTAADGRFILGRSGRPVRFWAVNGPPHELQGEELRRSARLLAKYGVNLVRMHGAVFDGRTLEPETSGIRHRIEMVEAMKQEGIYSHLSIYFPLWSTPRADLAWLPGYDGNRHPFATLMFNPEFQKRYREWWRLLLTTKGPSGRALIDEPALMGVELQNEDSFFFWTFTPENIPDAQLRILEDRFSDWCRRKYGSLEAALRAWNNVGTPRDALAQGRLGFRPIWNWFNDRTPRDQDTVAFLTEVQRDFYADHARYLRSLGFKGLITASNWTTASAEILTPLEKYTYAVGDFIDRHGYFAGERSGEGSSWSIRAGHTYIERSALRFDGAPGKPKVFEHPAMDPRYNGLPSMISETTWDRPNRYRTEAPLFFAAYGALQDSAAIVHFAFDTATWSVKPNFWMQPWTLMSPTQVGQFPASALIYRRGLVSIGDPMAEVPLSVADLKALKGTPLAQGASFDALRLADVPEGAATLKPGNVIDPLIHLVGRTDVRFVDGAAPPATVADLRPFIDRAGQTVTSSTRQLRLDYGTGLLRIDAPSAQGLVGNLKAAGSTRLSAVEIQSPMENVAIIAVALDGQPLGRSRRILVQAVSEEKPSGWDEVQIAERTFRITSIGSDPWLAREVSGRIRLLRDDAASLRVTALNIIGQPAGAAGTAAGFDLLPRSPYYLIEPR